MPGFILHLTAGVMALNILQDHKFHMNAKERNDFLIGCLLPDATKNKDASHFRNPKYHGNIVEYPDLELFNQKYDAWRKMLAVWDMNFISILTEFSSRIICQELLNFRMIPVQRQRSGRMLAGLC